MESEGEPGSSGESSGIGIFLFAVSGLWFQSENLEDLEGDVSDNWTAGIFLW